MTREQALAEHLSIDEDEATELIESDDYLVLTDDEADERAAEYIKGSLWAFNASFIIENSDLPWEAEEMVKSHQEKSCEGANDTIAALITDMDTFIEAAIGADGRGHFMSSYDGHEHEVGEYFIYRIN